MPLRWHPAELRQRKTLRHHINGGAAGAGGGGGGGGGGGIKLVFATSINASGSQLLVNGGAAGTDASSTSTNQPGNGGFGGFGGFGNPVADQAFTGSTPGSAGYTFSMATPLPENVLL